jgi:hypothetical protein
MLIFLFGYQSFSTAIVKKYNTQLIYLSVFFCLCKLKHAFIVLLPGRGIIKTNRKRGEEDEWPRNIFFLPTEFKSGAGQKTPGSPQKLTPGAFLTKIIDNLNEAKTLGRTNLLFATVFITSSLLSLITKHPGNPQY